MEIGQPNKYTVIILRVQANFLTLNQCQNPYKQIFFTATRRLSTKDEAKTHQNQTHTKITTKISLHLNKKTEFSFKKAF